MPEHNDPQYDAVVGRLRGLANAPIDPAAADAHLHAMRSVEPARRATAPSRRRRFASVAAVTAGLFLGSAALAGAATGNLPDTAQQKAHDALAKVGIKVPDGKGKSDTAKANAEGGPGKVERFLGDDTTPCTNADGTPFEGNHGQYVKGHEDDEATADVNERQEAAQSRCGKPVQAGGEAGTDADDGTGKGKPDDTGKPEQPGQSGEHKPADAGKPADKGRPDDTPRGPKAGTED